MVRAGTPGGLGEADKGEVGSRACDLEWTEVEYVWGLHGGRDMQQSRQQGIAGSPHHLSTSSQRAIDIAVAHGGDPKALGAKQLEEPRDAQRVDSAFWWAVQNCREQISHITELIGHTVDFEEVKITCSRSWLRVTNR